MKRYLIAIIGVAFMLQMTAQNVFVIHKKDGSTIETPIESELSFTGKAKVNDNEYVCISDIRLTDAKTKGENPQANVDIDYRGVQNYGGFTHIDGYGYFASTTPGVTEESALFRKNHVASSPIEVTSEIPSFALDSISYNTIYYLRAYVDCQGKRYYSSERSFDTGLPYMQWFITDIPEAFLTEKLYVYPTSEAWNAFFEKHSPYFASDDTLMRENILKAQWNQYLTIEKVKDLSKLCSKKQMCRDGVVCMLDEINDEFFTTFENMECVMYGTIGLLLEQCSFTTAPDTIICSEEFNVPNNTYYVFNPIRATSNIEVVYQIISPMLANQEYEVEIVMAPDTEVEESKKRPNKMTISYKNGNVTKEESLEKSVVTDINVCTIHRYTIVPKSFGQNIIEISSKVAVVESQKYNRALRIAKIKVREMKK